MDDNSLEGPPRHQGSPARVEPGIEVVGKRGKEGIASRRCRSQRIGDDEAPRAFHGHTTKDDSQSGKEPLPHRKVLVAPLHFSNEVYLLKNKLKLPEAQWKRTLLSRYANRVDEEGVDALYFPIHINRNHWIAGEIDFKRNTEPIGDSIRLESSEYIPHKFHENLRRWTRRAFGKNFTCEGNALQHAIQDDEYSCGIVTANTIEHAIHNNTPLWSPANASASRVDWFIRIVHNRSLGS